MKNFNNFNNNKEHTVCTVTCTAVCGHADDDIHIEDVFPITDFIVDSVSVDCQNILSDFFNDIVEELDLHNKNRCFVNENDKEIFAIRSDGSFVLVYDFKSSVETVENVCEWFVKNNIEERLIESVTRSRR